MDFIAKEYERQKKIFHQNPFNRQKELHHAFSRTGIFLGCGRFLIPGEQGHHNNYRWVMTERERLRPDKLIAENNYVKGMGCKAKVFENCENCLIYESYQQLVNKK